MNIQSKYKYSFLIIILSFICLNGKEESMIRIPLKLVNNTFEKYPVSKELNYTLEKEEKVKTIFGTKIRRLKEEHTGEVTIVKSNLFAAPIEIGKQNFYVILDTGSINLWVPLLNSSDKYEIERHYIPGSSAIKNSETFEIKYGTGSTKGNFYTDDVKFVTDYSLRIKFGAATETVFNVEGADGIMGLAKVYSSPEYSPIWTLYSKYQINKKSFSFKYIKDDKVDMYLGTEHEDFENKNQTAECQLLTESNYDSKLWTCKLYTVGLISEDNKKNNTVEFGYNFLFDTGSNTMILPYELLTKLKKNISQFNCYEGESKNGIQIICDDENNLPNMVLEVGNYYLVLDKQMYYRTYNKTENKYRYVLNAVFEEKITISLIGQPFFQMFHTRFDYENKKLKFYSDNPDAIKPARIKPKNDKAKYYDGKNWLDEHLIKIIASVAIVIAALAILCFIRKCFRKMCCPKKSSKSI